MLKFVFWTLLCINGVLLAYSQGALGNFAGNEREPARMKNQLNTDKLVLMSAARINAAAASPAAAPAAPAPPACFEWGDLALADARRFETRLAPLDLGTRLVRRAAAMSDPTSHIVFVPPQGSKEAAERKTAELKAMGVTNYFIMNDNSPMKWGISLGVFKSEAAAQTLLASLNKQGVHSARLAARGAQASKLAFQFRSIDATTKSQIDDIAGSFAALAPRSCK